LLEALKKLNPRIQIKNPIMFIVYIGALLTTGLMLRDIIQQDNIYSFILQINLWLWFTVLFANFAEAIAEGRGKAQAQAVKAARSQIKAKLYSGNTIKVVDSAELRKGNLILI
jgi:K+-transporting ATPase ATPase B chain